MNSGGVYHLDNGLVGYGAGLGVVDPSGEHPSTGDPCLILSVETDSDGGTWSHIVRLKYAERLPCSHVVHLKEEP